MQTTWGQTTVELVQGDITRQTVDAIVNAANRSLMGGGGVDGAIHAAAGPQLLAETRLLGGCEVGEAKLSKGYRLPASHIIHTVGPMYRGGQHGEPQLLADAHRNSLRLAVEHRLKQIAFPAISAGIYGYPVDQAATVALQTVCSYLAEEPTHITLVRFVLYNKAMLDTWMRVLTALID